MDASEYVDREGELVFAPPFKTDPVDFYGFILDADIDRLSAVCDKYLNAPLDRVCDNRRFVPAGGFVLVACIDIPKMYSSTKPYSDWGWFKEKEIGFWILVIDQDTKEMYWHMPYMWVDNPYAMAMGRELYGFPKGLGEIMLPGTPDKPDQFALNTLVLPVFSAQQEGVVERLVSIEKTSRTVNHGAIIENFDTLLSQLFKLMREEEEIGFAELVVNEWEDFLHKKMPMVFLKEFRDAADPANACYQSIVETKPSARNVQNLRIFDKAFDITIFPCASHPIVSDLGLKLNKNNKLTSNISFHTNFEFEIGTGTVTQAKPKPKQKPKKLVIIGGGVGSMTTAFEITSRPDWQQLYESITVYQMGWRLGGKGASGINSTACQWEESGRVCQEKCKIEEHGLHIWLGFYNNAFQVMQQAYHELGRAPGTPLATWSDAFKKHSYIVLAQQFKEQWHPWELNFPENCDIPGKGTPLPTLWDYIVYTVEWIESTLLDSPYSPCARAESPAEDRKDVFAETTQHFVTKMENLVLGSARQALPEPVRLALETARLALKTAPSASAPLEVAQLALKTARHALKTTQLAIQTGSFPDMTLEIVRLALEAARPLIEFHCSKIVLQMKLMDKDATKHTKEQHLEFLTLLKNLKELLFPVLKGVIDSDLELRRLFILLDTGITGITGLIEDDVLFHEDTLGKLDNEDLREWLARHGAEDITVNSPLMQGLYDLVFAYENGDTGKPNFAAGTAIRCIFRICFTYKGAIFWKMQAGMGDTIFTPLHKVLEKRGVEFKFFHKVNNLAVGQSAGGESYIKAIAIGRQATVKDGKAYDPYINAGGLPCWPSTPDYDQLVEGDTLKQENINLESFYTTWQDVEEITLHAGEDFDEVVYGASMATIPYLCAELVNADEKWKKAVEKVGTVRTMAFQAWLTKDLQELGWSTASPVLDAFVEPLNTWADMSHLIAREHWPASGNIRNIAYFCGPLQGGIPPATEKDEPQKALRTVREESDKLMNQDIKAFWPDFDSSRDIADRYYRANIDPTERYVLSLKGSTQYRLDGRNSGFGNLFLVGDWTICGLNAGCVEAAAISGMLASHAMTGCPDLDSIDGWQDIF